MRYLTGKWSENFKTTETVKKETMFKKKIENFKDK